MLERFRAGDPLAAVRARWPSADVLPAARAAVRDVHVADDVAGYVVALARATRETPLLRLGASPRASLALLHAAQAWAALAGRDFVTPDDIQALVVPVLAHRLLLSRDALDRASRSRARCCARSWPRPSPPGAGRRRRARPEPRGRLSRGQAPVRRVETSTARLPTPGRRLSRAGMR